MKKQWIVVYYTHYGDDWLSQYKDIFESEDEAKQFEASHRKEHEGVRGIEHIEFHYSLETEKHLRNILTVNEYIQLFPDVKDLLDDRIR